MTSWLEALRSAPRLGQAAVIGVSLGSAILLVSVPHLLANDVEIEILALLAMFVLAAVAIVVDVLRVGLEEATGDALDDWS